MIVDVIPCSPAANTGELKTLSFLREKLELLPSRHTILTNYHLPNQNATLEIDLVVINGQGVFLLEVKDWRGPIWGDSTHWLHAKKRHLSPLTSIDIKAKRVKGELVQNSPNLNKVSVVGFVVLVNGDTRLTLDDHPDRKKRVFSLNDQLIYALTSRDYVYSSLSIRLDKFHFQAVKDKLICQKVDPERRLIGNYEIVRELASGETYDAFEAQHINISNRRARLKRYHISTIHSERHLEEAVRKFRQDMEALAQLEDYPNIVHAYDFFKDLDVDDTYYLALEFVDGRTLREIIDDETEEPPLRLDSGHTLAQIARYLIPVADALVYCHQQGIVHRNLTPYSIYITDDGQVKLGDFDFARVPAIGQTISKTGQVLVENKYIAPEQLDDPRSADFRADLYSLGVIWYDMLFRCPESEPVRIDIVAKSDLPEDVRQLLRRLLAQRPDDRPGSAIEVKEWFEILA
jgi:serine/threonine protein kinase